MLPIEAISEETVEEDKEEAPSPTTAPIETGEEIVEPEEEVLPPLEVDSSSSELETVVEEETLSPQNENLTTPDTEKNDPVGKNSAPSKSENDNELARAATNNTETETTKPIATTISPAVLKAIEKVATLPKTGTQNGQRNLPNILGLVSLLFGGLFLKLTSKKENEIKR